MAMELSAILLVATLLDGEYLVSSIKTRILLLVRILTSTFGVQRPAFDIKK